jgi:prepilin-type N-terminal cleavage/methylation domain-containing protein
MKRKAVQGFTLVELAVVLVIMGMLAGLTTPNIVEGINAKRAAVTVQETQTIVDAARAFRAKNGSWPGGATCATALNDLSTSAPPFLVGVGAINKYGSVVSTSCTASTFSVDQNAIADWDGWIANSLPGTVIADPATNLVRSTIGIPGTEPAMDGKLSRYATGNAELNRMRTTLLLGGYDISEVNHLSTNTINAAGNVQAGSMFSTGTMSANGVITSQSAVNSGGTMWSAGTITSGTAVNSSGTMYANGVITSGTAVTTSGTMWAAGQITSNSSILSAGDVTAYGNMVASGQVVSGSTLTAQGAANILGVLTANGQSQFGGQATFYDQLNIQRVVGENTGCGVIGAIARDYTGKTLSCQDWLWKSNGGGSKVLTGFITHGQQIPLPAGATNPATCNWSASDAANAHPGSRPDYAGGNYAAADANRIVSCGFIDKGALNPGGTCAFVISCN